MTSHRLKTISPVSVMRLMRLKGISAEESKTKISGVLTCDVKNVKIK